MKPLARTRENAPAPLPNAPEACADCGSAGMVASVVTAAGEQNCRRCWADGTGGGRAATASRDSARL
jgi:hypothetical protein